MGSHYILVHTFAYAIEQVSNNDYRHGEAVSMGLVAAAGYGILDENVDSDTPSPVEILTAQALIAEYETLALRIFGVSKVNLDILQRMRTCF
jgi:3-dehydroquinate synthetase